MRFTRTIRSLEGFFFFFLIQSIVIKAFGRRGRNSDILALLFNS